jgi:hypothetical protein
VIGRVKRWWGSRGGLPESLRAELEAEGLELVEERMEGRVTYRGYTIVGQRPSTGDQPTTASLALTPRRLAIRGTQGVHVDAPPGTVRSELAEPGALLLKYDAQDIYPNRSGSVEMLLRTPRAADIHARLQAWTQTSIS